MSASLTPYVRGAEQTHAKHGIDGCYQVAETGCWIWKQALNGDGYGILRRAGEAWSAHRYSWTLVNGPIPDEMTIDHLCFNPPCVNPDHMRLLTRADNAANRRPMRRQGDHCRNGHEFTPENTYLRREPGGGDSRQCRECGNSSARRRRAERAAIEAEVASLQAGA